MSITSLTFFAFVFAVLIVYYVVPKKVQWMVLLAASIGFYLSFGVKSIIYVLITATTVYAGTRLMDSISTKQKQYVKEHKETLSKDEKKQLKAKAKKRRKAVMLITLFINLGLLCTFKYFHFALEQVNNIAGLFGSSGIEDTFKLIVPLGISFYTFQSIGYLVDVYWDYYKPEKNYFKVLLFVSFFPQMTQGPISDFEVLTGELFKEHKFDYKNYSWGFQRMLWGFMKKLLIADLIAPALQVVFKDYNNMTGLTCLVAAFSYSVQIYADFSGYMDIMCGLCEMFGIKLTENFERPYFSKSIAEYWRRWHISLGAWFKKYIYYPIGMSNWSRKLAKNTKDKFGKHFSNTMPATIALVVTWLATGLWHGASWAYITWGLVNGLFIIFSLWMEPVYDKWKKALKINESAWLWRAFQTVRTFILVTFIKVLPEVGTLRNGYGLIKRIFTNFDIPQGVHNLFPYNNKYDVVIIAGLTLLIFVTSLMQRKKPIREYFAKVPCPIRIVILGLLFVAIAAYGMNSDSSGGFLYAQF